MSDQMHLAELLSGFIGSCGLDPPFHMVAIGSNGRVRFSLCTANGSATVALQPRACAGVAGRRDVHQRGRPRQIRED